MTEKLLLSSAKLAFPIKCSQMHFSMAVFDHFLAIGKADLNILFPTKYFIVPFSQFETFYKHCKEIGLSFAHGRVMQSDTILIKTSDETNLRYKCISETEQIYVQMFLESFNSKKLVEIAKLDINEFKLFMYSFKNCLLAFMSSNHYESAFFHYLLSLDMEKLQNFSSDKMSLVKYTINFSNEYKILPINGGTYPIEKIHYFLELLLIAREIEVLFS